jgi:hypothetical protein
MTEPLSYRAQRVDDLLRHDELTAAFNEVRQNALEQLAVTEASDTTAILRLQAMAGCLTDVRDALRAVLLAAGKFDGGSDL